MIKMIKMKKKHQKSKEKQRIKTKKQKIKIRIREKENERIWMTVRIVMMETMKKMTKKIQILLKIQMKKMAAMYVLFEMPNVCLNGNE